MGSRIRPARLAEVLSDLRFRLGDRTYSQEGEDRILARHFDGAPPGFYVDVGAHHPYRFSNTYLLYRMGWRGVNIDAMPGSMKRFRRHRPRDVNVEAAIGSAAGAANYFVFNEPALNTFDAELAATRNRPPWHLVAQVSLPLRRLDEVLRESVASGTRIELLNVDVEGRDLDVLCSNDWAQFRPRVVLVETLQWDIANPDGDPSAAFLRSLGYTMAAKTVNTAFFIDRPASPQRP